MASHLQVRENVSVEQERDNILLFRYDGYLAVVKSRDSEINWLLTINYKSTLSEFNKFYHQATLDDDGCVLFSSYILCLGDNSLSVFDVSVLEDESILQMFSS